MPEHIKTTSLNLKLEAVHLPHSAASGKARQFHPPLCAGALRAYYRSSLPLTPGFKNANIQCHLQMVTLRLLAVSAPIRRAAEELDTFFTVTLTDQTEKPVFPYWKNDFAIVTHFVLRPQSCPES